MVIRWSSIDPVILVFIPAKECRVITNTTSFITNRTFDDQRAGGSTVNVATTVYYKLYKYVMTFFPSVNQRKNWESHVLTFFCVHSAYRCVGVESAGTRGGWHGLKAGSEWVREEVRGRLRLQPVRWYDDRPHSFVVGFFEGLRKVVHALRTNQNQKQPRIVYYVDFHYFHVQLTLKIVF